MPELERGTESLTTAVGPGRDSINLGTESRTDYLVLPNEVQSLAERSGYVRYHQWAVRIHFAYQTYATKNVFRECSVAHPPLSLPSSRAKLALPRSTLSWEG
jgi:hypothetical protein